jgi:hypothetical protein
VAAYKVCICGCIYSVYLWLHIQSALNMEVNVWIYGYYIVDILNILNDGLTPCSSYILYTFVHFLVEIKTKKNIKRA